MVNPDTKHGILDDRALGYVRKSGPAGNERTETVPFMALDLLCDEYWRGEVERLYRHDLEGLIWILPWVFLQFSEKKRKSYQLQP